MFKITVETMFRAAHSLGLADGLKEPEHAHDWSVAAEVGAAELDRNGLVMDFCQLRRALDAVVAPLQEEGFEAVAYFRGNNSSAENVARYVFENLEPRLPEGVELLGVVVGEARGCCARFEK